MRARLVIWFLVLALAPEVAQATHTGSSCSASLAVVVGGVTIPSCSMSLSCPSAAGHTCSFRLAAAANGIGLVAARVFVPGQGLPFTFCTGALSCSSSASGYVVPAGASRAVSCSGGDVAVNETVSCSATAT